MERRKSRRNLPKVIEPHNVTYQTIHEQPVVSGVGTLLGISEHGCRVGEVHRLKKGQRIQLALPNQTGQPPTIVSNCVLAWVRESEFGVQFLW
jgi:PilZ domain-containing protein